jgi:hypothetical protein
VELRNQVAIEVVGKKQITEEEEDLMKKLLSLD